MKMVLMKHGPASRQRRIERRFGWRFRAALIPALLGLLAISQPVLAQAGDTALPTLDLRLPSGPAVRSLGILMAEERGYFAAAGLDVTVSHAELGQSPVTDLAEEHTDLAIEIMPVALRQRAEGAEVVHIAQFFQRGSLALICRPEIDQPGKLAGRNVGVWLGGWESSFYAWLNRLGLSYFASGGGVTILRQGPDAEAFLARETDCFTTTSYLAPLQLADLGKERKDLVHYAYEELGLSVLEDGLYARAADLTDPARVDLFARFLSAAARGWQSVREEPKAARRLLASQTENAGRDAVLLTESLNAVIAALGRARTEIGSLDAVAFDRTVTLLLTGAPEPVLTAAPTQALSDAVFSRRRGAGGVN
jgi:NitT/TauT family transport system substrate-binding protein